MQTGLFDGKYKIVKLLGSGGMGNVYLAEHVRLGNFWAIKQVSKRTSSGIDLLAEPNILKRLSHPALPRIVDIVEDEDNIFIVMDYIDGVALDKELEQRGCFPEKIVIEWAKQMCDVLSYLHAQKPQPIIYRDTKPSNIILKDGNIKLIDFGIAREYDAKSVTDTVHIGTRGYAAPEQYGGKTDARTDIYSLGVTLYHLLTGKSPNEPPYEFASIRQLNDRLSVGIEHVICKCTQQNPQNRYQTANELLHDLNNIYKFERSYRKQVAKRRLVLTVLFALICGFGYLSYAGWTEIGAEKERAYQAFLSAGTEDLAKLRFEDAIISFSEAIEIFPNRLQGYKDVAKVYLSEKEWDKCINYLHNIVLSQISEAAYDSDISYLLGTAYFEKKDYGQASTYFRHAAQIDPGNIIYHRDMVISIARLGRVEEAKQILTEKIESGYSDKDTIQYLYGEINWVKGEFQEAVSAFRKAIELTGSEEIKTKSYIAIAEIYRDNPGQFEDSYRQQVAILELAINTLEEKFNVVLIEMLGQAYFNLGLSFKVDTPESTANLDKAATQFDLLLSRGYQFPYLYRNLGIIYHYLGRLEQSEEILLIMKDKYPDNYRSYLELALLYASIENQKPNAKRDYSRTEKCYQAAVQLSPLGDRDPELQPLINLIAELREGGWLD